jgi:hypothetical protein
MAVMSPCAAVRALLTLRVDWSGLKEDREPLEEALSSVRAMPQAPIYPLVLRFWQEVTLLLWMLPPETSW